MVALISKPLRPLVIQFRAASRRVTPSFRGVRQNLTVQAGATRTGGRSQALKFTLGGLGVVSVGVVAAANHYGITVKDLISPEKKKEAPPPLEVPEPPSDENKHPYDDRSVRPTISVDLVALHVRLAGS
jgi:hypothetical protein